LKALQLNPDLAIAANRLENYKSNLAGAIVDNNRTVELTPKLAIAYYERGNGKADKGDWAGAIADYDRAIELNPKNAAAYNARSSAKGKKGDLAGAVADLKRGLELDPKK